MEASARVTLAHNIKTLRVSKGWSQERLAEQCQLHRTYIGGIERRERNVGIDNIEKIANALEVPIEALVKPISLD